MNPLVLLRRLLLAIPTLFGVALVVFVLMRVVPGDPIAMMIPPGAGPEDINRLRALYGLDRGIAEQFVIWMRQVASGHFGTSITFRQDVVTLIAERLPATLELGLVAMLLACLLGGTAGVFSAAWHGRWLSSVIDGIAAMVQAIPDFLWGLIFILLFGVVLPWLPISGRLDGNTAPAAASRLSSQNTQSMVAGSCTHQAQPCTIPLPHRSNANVRSLQPQRAADTSHDAKMLPSTAHRRRPGCHSSLASLVALDRVRRGWHWSA